MTTLRPEHDGEIGASYEPHGGQDARADADDPDDQDAFEAVVSGLADPLTDPIPGGAYGGPPAGGGPGEAPQDPPRQGRGAAARDAEGRNHGLTPAPAIGFDGSAARGTGAGTGSLPPETPAAPPAPPERPAGKHARPATPPTPAPAPAPAAPPDAAAPDAAVPGATGPAAPPARHAVRQPAPAPEVPAAPAPAPTPPGGEATAFLPRTPPAPEPAPGPAASPTAAAFARGRTAPPPAAAPAPGPVGPGPVTPPPAPAPAPAAPLFSDAEQTLISGPLGSTTDPASAAVQVQAQVPAPAGQTQAATPSPAPTDPMTTDRPKTTDRVTNGPTPTAPEPSAVGGVDQETVALRSSDVRRAVGAEGDAAAPTGGRAERRKAAKSGSRGRKRPEAAAAQPPRPPGRPLTRMEARQAARALKDSPGVVVSRAVGELFISFGVLMLLFVTYQLWWTNVRADNFANNEASKIQSTWQSQKGPAAGAFEPGQGFAIIHIPKLDVVAPIAQGVSTEKVLDHGEVGHYSEGSLKTAMPEDKTGNFALAGHRNTHGEPFRYINQLVPGDKVVVETQDEYYTYQMTRTLPQTTAANVGVISPIPEGSGFTKPGRYITLTTCTPEFTSTYRLIVWGKMVSEQPRSQGLPAALQHH